MTTRVTVDPNILIWFREDAGYHDINSLPKSLRENVIKWESGEKKPTWNQLRELGNKYKKPATFFLMENPQKNITDDYLDYRTITDIPPYKSPNFIYEIRRAVKRRQILLQLLGSTYNNHNSHILLDINKNKSNTIYLADKIKKLLGVTLKDQNEWGKKDYKHYAALSHWKNTIENLNILVFETKGVPITEFRGMAISKFPLPIILLNGSDSPNARIFTLIHELIHILQKNSAICDLTENNKIEKFCNKLTGEILVPKKSLENMEIVSSKNSNIEWTDNDLRNLSNHFAVSRDLILTRLLILNKTTPNFYRSTLKRWKEESLKKPKNKGGSFDYKTITKLNGKLYSKQMVKAYDNDLINSVEFSRFMGGIKLKHYSDLKENLLGGQ